MEATNTSTNLPETDRRLESILDRFPDRFSDEQIVQIRARIGRSIELGNKLRGHDLDNGIGPVFDPRAMQR